VTGDDESTGVAGSGWQIDGSKIIMAAFHGTDVYQIAFGGIIDPG
jgi:hypothetical protein